MKAQICLIMIVIAVSPVYAQDRTQDIDRSILTVAPLPPTPEAVTAPPSNADTTERPSNLEKPNKSTLHSVGIGELLCNRVRLCCRRIIADPEP